MYPDENEQQEAFPSFREERMERRRRGPAILAGILIGVAVAAAVGWLTFGRYVTVYQGGDGELPLIRADGGAERIRPETPGGLDVPNQDKLVYDRMRRNENDLPVERLLPLPEQPVAPEQEYAPLDVAEAQASDDPIGHLAEQVEEETEIASATVYDERGKPVEVMFKTVTTETAAVPPAAPEKPASEKPAPVKVKAAPAPVPAAVPAEEPAFSVQLLSTRSAETAEQEWNRLSRKHKELMDGLPHQVSRVSVEKGVFFRLRVGHFKTRDEAKKLCDQFKAKKQECLVVK